MTSWQTDRYVEDDSTLRTRRWQTCAIIAFALIAHLAGLMVFLSSRVVTLDIAAGQPAGNSLSVRLVGEAAPATTPAKRGQPAQQVVPTPPRKLEPDVSKRLDVTTVKAPSTRTVQRSAEQAQQVSPVSPVAPSVQPQAAATNAPAAEAAATHPSDAQANAAPSLALPKMLGPRGTHELGCRISQPVYPAKARRLQQAGTVTIKITIGLDGNVSDATVLRSSGYDLLDAAALDAIRSGKCNPYMDNGYPEVVQATQPIAFGLDD